MTQANSELTEPSKVDVRERPRAVETILAANKSALDLMSVGLASDNAKVMDIVAKQLSGAVHMRASIADSFRMMAIANKSALDLMSVRLASDNTKAMETIGKQLSDIGGMRTLVSQNARVMETLGKQLNDFAGMHSLAFNNFGIMAAANKQLGDIGGMRALASQNASAMEIIGKQLSDIGGIRALVSDNIGMMIDANKQLFGFANAFDHVRMIEEIAQQLSDLARARNFAYDARPSEYSEQINPKDANLINISDITSEVLTYLAKNPQQLFGLSSELFELLICNRLEAMGLDVERPTNHAFEGDGGIDIIAWAKGALPLLLAVQVKHHQKEKTKFNLVIFAIFGG
jgi:hypothetical protein